MKIKVLLVLLVFCTKLVAQDDRQIIQGKVYNDSLLISNVHIINKNSKYGTVSNDKGIYNIPVKLNDTLQLTGIQFHTMIIIVNSNHVKNKIINTHLIEKTNELEEIEIKSNSFSGNLITDIDKVKINSNIADGVLDFSNIDIRADIIGANGDNGKPPDASKLTNPHIPIGLTLVKVSLGKPFKKKKELVQLLIRKEFGDEFFIKILNIPLIHIDPFLDQCKKIEITQLYKMDKKLEFIDALIKESKNYLKDKG